jgi:hypothetical protein
MTYSTEDVLEGPLSSFLGLNKGTNLETRKHLAGSSSEKKKLIPSSITCGFAQNKTAAWEQSAAITSSAHAGFLCALA